MTDLALCVEGLSKRYRIGKSRGLRDLFQRSDDPSSERSNGDILWALKDVSFEVKRGEVLGIIGRNGAGKSTLLKILSRITEPTEGRAILNGRVGSLLEVGTGFHPELTGRENIYLNGAILGMKKREIGRKFDEIIAFAETEKFLDTPVKRYSSGMYVRLAFAVAAHLEPEILVVDEVLAVGDVAFQKKCLGKMGGVAKEGRTVLFVSHNVQAIRQLCRRGILLMDGHIVADGPSGETVDIYLQSMTTPTVLDDIPRIISQLPPDPAFRLINASVLQNGYLTSDVANGEPVVLQMEYEVLQETHGLHVYFRLRDSEGILIFESFHNGDVAEIPTVSPGGYVSRAIIPANFLAPTQYELNINAAISNVRAIYDPIRIPLNVQATGRVHSAYPGYLTPGKLAPLIEWHTEKYG